MKVMGDWLPIGLNMNEDKLGCRHLLESQQDYRIPAFAHDDGLLTQAGDLAIARDAQNGLITGTTLDTLSDAWTYNSYGEPASYTASGPSGDLYTVTYTRDLLGRITEKAETIAGDEMTWCQGTPRFPRLLDIQFPAGSSGGVRCPGAGMGWCTSFQDWGGCPPRGAATSRMS